MHLYNNLKKKGIRHLDDGQEKLIYIWNLEYI